MKTKQGIRELSIEPGRVVCYPVIVQVNDHHHDHYHHHHLNFA